MDDEKNPQEYEEEFLADAARRAHEEELEMLANIAIIRSTMMGQRDQIREEAHGSDGKSKQKELERRLLLRMNSNRVPDEAELERQRRLALRKNEEKNKVPGTDTPRLKDKKA